MPDISWSAMPTDRTAAQAAGHVDGEAERKQREAEEDAAWLERLAAYEASQGTCQRQRRDPFPRH
jgi:hypothetical protein